MDSLYLTDVETFRQLIEYELSEIKENSTKPPRLVMSFQGGYIEPNYDYNIEDFSRFRRELRMLGFDIDKGKVIPTTGHAEEDSKLTSELETMLGRLDPDYPKILNVAWDAILSDSSDKYRQTAVSIRELVDKVIDRLAPSDGNRRNRVRQILGSETEAELVDAVANTVVKLHGLQSKLHAELAS